ncbi:MAG: shikimate kinase [Atribacterota bacterium]
MLKRNIFITGFMGTGKSTVAHTLSNQMGKKCIDIDSIIENREGKPIVNIFNEEGESYFRKLEKEVLKEILKKKNLIIATGGGTLLDEENFQLARKNGIIVLLKARPEVIFNRLKKENTRPLLSGENMLEKIICLMNKRKKQYSRFTNCIDTSDIPVEEVVKKVLKICQGDEYENN